MAEEKLEKTKDMERSKEMARLVIEAIEDKKGEDIRVIDISAVSTLGDYFIIASGNSNTQIKAITDAIEEKLGRAGFGSPSTEGYEGARWVLMDYQDVIVHIFDKENRLFYDLERIWRDGKQIGRDEIVG